MKGDARLRLDRISPALAEATGDSSWLHCTAEQLIGGKSNLTFRLRTDRGRFIFRRPPTGELLPSAHDMLREARVQRALTTTPVPTPRIILTDGGDLLGVPFYVMEEVDGHTIRDTLPDPYATSAQAKHALADSFVDTLANLHAVDPVSVGLDGFGYPQGFMARQVRRWRDQWVRSKTQDVAEVDDLGERLASAQPEPARASIVHGDYRLDNVIVDRTQVGKINAVLDWELSTLGDPLADVALLILFWRAADERPLSLTPGVTHLEGFPSRDDVLARYASSSGTDVSDLAYYLAFAHFKFAIVTQGVAARFDSGAMGTQRLGNLEDEVRYLGERGLTFI